MNDFVVRLKKNIALFIIHLFNHFPLKKNKVFFYSYYGSQYGCNPKYISEYMLQNDPNGQFDIVWAFNHPKLYNELTGVRIVKTMSLKYFYEMCTSQIIITNFRTTEFFIKRKNQYYIQTWHSSLRLKQIEKDAENSLPQAYIDMAKEDSTKCDLLLSGCKFSTNIFNRSFWYDGKIFEVGTPRNDCLFDENPRVREKTFKKLYIPQDHKIILYAPTFRKDNDLKVYDLDYSRLLLALRIKFGGEWICLVKLHPHLISQTSKIIQGNHVLDVTNYNDIQELLSISDALITDYSSLMFDYSITKRPCFLYVPDLIQFTQQDRNLYFDVLDLPFKAALSNDDLIKAINLFDAKSYQNDLNHFDHSIGSYENGSACESIVNHIKNVCFNQAGGKIDEAI